MAIVQIKSLPLAGYFRHLCSKAPVNRRLFPPLLDQTGAANSAPSNSDRTLSTTDAGGSPAATHFLLLRQKKVSKEKATHCIAPSGFPKSRASNGPLANSWLVDGFSQNATSGTRHSNSASGRRPLLAQNFGEATWGIQKARKSTPASRATYQKTTVILSSEQGQQVPAHLLSLRAGARCSAHPRRICFSLHALPELKHWNNP
jgi:hypothetical protein